MDNESLIKELLAGKENTVQFEIEGLSEPLTLRPLTNGELLQLKIIEKGNQQGTVKVKKNMSREDIKEQVQDMESNSNINYADIVKNEFNTKYEAIKISASLSIGIIKRLPTKILDDIFAKIIEISEITKDDLSILENFRKEQ